MDTQLRTRDIEAGLTDERWLGHGYLGERWSRTRAAQRRADRYLLREANALGLDRDRLVQFVVSKNGRWFADLVFGGWDDAEVERCIERWGRDLIREFAS